jgi:hypothetical protein
MTSESCFVAVNCGLFASLTVTATELVPLAVGVPLSRPDEAFSANPAGNPVADHVYGDLPPVAPRVTE